ncbi:DUF1569 domain-containing protein [Allomuricauda sp. d1]|uniref:DUF1569 domain-containing protein n=1 Tax=Allomuricauda sp. d1 TaxID=3136725 RepID=UPI0031DFAA8E
MKSLFEKEAYDELLERLEKITPDSERLWGKMSPAQMAWHCQFPLKIAVENKDRGVSGNPLVRLLFKKTLYNDKLWRKNLPTAPGLKATEEKDFDEEMPKLKQLVTACYEARERDQWHPHPLFGKLTPEQWGKMEYKHLDHHLRQFGV